jgi:hypothetical protein
MKELQKGTKVFDIRYGWGKIQAFINNIYTVDYDIHKRDYYSEGKYSVCDGNPLLSLTEYSLEKGGFTPIHAEPPLQVGELAFFYFHNGTHLHYSAIADINNDCNGNPIKYFTVCGYTFDYASREIPQWFLDKQKEYNV